jgi:hypothetical protein
MHLLHPGLKETVPLLPACSVQSGSERRAGDDKTQVLDEFCRDLCQEAREQRTDPVSPLPLPALPFLGALGAALCYTMLCGPCTHRTLDLTWLGCVWQKSGDRLGQSNKCFKSAGLAVGWH